tara:strand:+ start:701 stop:1414 length:714 start_codon:yes stop_codon:yes gene_type:complete
MILKDISVKYNTDKEVHHQYLDSYEKHIRNSIKREDVKKVVEIGVSYGDSLLMWAEYFPNAEIIGADIMDYARADYKLNIGGVDGGTIVDRRDVLLDNPRIKTYVLDQTNEQSIKDFKCIIGNDCDIIIDDGGHSMEMHQKTIKYLLDCVKTKGLYIIEDLHTCSFSVDELYGFTLVQQGDTLTTHLLEDWRDKTNLIHYTNYLSDDNIKSIKNKIDKIEIDMCKISEIAFIYKNKP